MHPILINIGPIPIHTYGFMVALGFLGAVFIIKTLAQQSQMNVDRVLDLTFFGLLVGFAGARLLFVITRFSTFMADPISIFKVWEGGLVFYGGPLAVLPWSVWYMKKHKLPMWRTSDVIVPGLVVGQILGRFGCVAAGCCYGKPTGSTWGFKFYSELVERSLHGVPLHPVQMYEAGANTILLAGLLWLFKRKSFDGQVGLAYFMAYPIIRSVVEAFRGDLIRGFVIDEVLSTSQFISILVFLGAASLYYFRYQQVHLEGIKKGAKKR